MDGDVVARSGWPGRIARRALLRAGLAGAVATALSLRGCGHLDPPPMAFDAGAPRCSPWNAGWLFGGGYTRGSERVGHDDRGFAAVSLPHTVVPLSWGDWDPATWQRGWIYRRHFAGRPLLGSRVFVDFDGVMTKATAVVNDRIVGTHRGGYLPWSVELTDHLVAGDNVLAVVVDSRCLPVPPVARGHGPDSVDYLQPGGIYRDATLRVVPRIHLADLFARPVDVLTGQRRVDVECTVDAAIGPARAELSVQLLDGTVPVAHAARTIDVSPGVSTTHLRLTGLDRLALWSPEQPQLYTVAAALSVPASGTDTLTRRIGLREASFRPDGFYLNGQRVKIFGLNRHQLYPYTGMAAPARLQRRDAEILRYDLNCNMVRCSHYPQSPHFLDACDEVGLMVWEETPGWAQIGDRAWQDIVVQNVHDMVVRDRNRPSVVVWGTRLDETHNDPALYARTRRLAHDLDGTRPTAGATQQHTTGGWAEHVLGFDDYHAAVDGAELMPPLPGVAYLVSEAVGALDGSPTYRWQDPAATLANQARLHARVHHLAGLDPRYAGVLGWAGVDYASLNGGDRVWRALKTPGVLDTFRIPKPAAAVYRSQVDPAIRPLVLPVFRWEFGPGNPPTGPGPDAMIATNCDRLEIYVGERHLATSRPDRARYGGLRYPPAFADLTVAGTGRPELRIDGYVGGRLVASVLMSADTTRDRLALVVEDTTIVADGSDSTRITLRAVDTYGNHRPGTSGEVSLTLTGPATLIGDNPFSFTDYGAAGCVFIRSRRDRPGTIHLTAEHPTLGVVSAQLSSTSTST